MINILTTSDKIFQKESIWLFYVTSNNKNTHIYSVFYVTSNNKNTHIYSQFFPKCFDLFQANKYS